MEHIVIGFGKVMAYGLPYVALFALGYLFLEFLRGRKK